MLRTSEKLAAPAERSRLAAIEARSVDRSYKLYRSQKEKIADALGVGWAVFGSKPPPNFPALTDVSFRVAHGERVGVVGRNGAGKSTLLKLVSGLLRPTAGTLTVNGSVQMLMYVGLGFYPEFTGLENIRASILYNDLPPDVRKHAEAEIIAFAELHEFLHQPLRTYSLGMRSRLQFACATALRPDILIIDEVLAVGDAYFLNKCVERIRKLTDTGCTLLLASHAMPQILNFCDRAVWIEKGQLAMDSDASAVVNSYQKFMQSLGT